MLTPIYRYVFGSLIEMNPEQTLVFSKRDFGGQPYAVVFSWVTVTSGDSKIGFNHLFLSVSRELPSKGEYICPIRHQRNMKNVSLSTTSITCVFAFCASC